MKFKHFFQELKRRHIFRVATVYVIVGWIIIQVVTAIFPTFDFPEWTIQFVIVLMAIGFPIALIVAWAFEMTPKGVKRTEVAVEESSSPEMTEPDVNLPALTETQEEPSAGASQSTPDNSIAVLPFTNASADPDQRYFSDGLSENMIIALSQYPGLNVIGRQSSFQLRNTGLDSKQIGEKLRVSTLLGGSVSRAGDEVRIRAELVSTKNGRTLWSNYYDRPYQNLFELQDDITTAVADALRTKLVGNIQSGKRTQTDRPLSGNLDAYNACLQGKFYFNRFTKDSWRDAIRHFQQAVTIDPEYAFAYALLSQARSMLGGEYLSDSLRQQAFTKARSAAETALKLNPSLAMAHVAKGILQLFSLEWWKAHQKLRKAYKLAPSDPGVKYWLSRTEAALGHISEAIRLTKERIASIPLDATAYNNLAVYLTTAGQYEAAEENIRRAISMQPDISQFNSQLVVIQIKQDNPTAALETLDSISILEYRLLAETFAFAAAGQQKQADQALQKLTAQYENTMAYQIAQVYACRQQPDQTFEWLDRAWEQKDPGLASLLCDPFLLDYQDDPRFTAFCNKIDLPVPQRNDNNDANPTALNTDNIQ